MKTMNLSRALQNTLMTAPDKCVDLKIAPTSILIDMLHRCGQDILWKHDRPRGDGNGQEVAQHNLGRFVRVSLQQLSECRLLMLSSSMSVADQQKKAHPSFHARQE